MKKIVWVVGFVSLIVVLLSACKKDPIYSPEKQLAIDEEIIKSFIAQNNISAVRHESGVYYVLTDPGTGSYAYDSLQKTYITVKYTGKTLNGNVFDDKSNGFYFGPPDFPNGLAALISGWQIGLVPKAYGGIVDGGLQAGGKIRLLIPSVYAYGERTVGVLPANAVLDFEIELVDIEN